WPGISPRGGCILPNGLEASPSIRRSVVGQGVAIDEGVTLDRCIVWPDVRVERSATNAVITADHIVAVS
ncbi:MAG: hypothetical protein WBN70_09635, partial [Polyangiales bacterium]